MREIKPCGDMALSVYFGDNALENEILDFKSTLESLKSSPKTKNALDSIVEIVPCYTSIFIQYNPFLTDFKTLSDFLHSIQITHSCTQTRRMVEIPLCYDFGLDFDRVEEHTSLSKQEIIEIHSSTSYCVRMLGFIAGFPYLLPTFCKDFKLDMPKLSTPRLEVQAGSVGLAGMQSGIYPVTTPGGWNIIAKTPIKIFEKESGALLQAGDIVRFIPITLDAFKEIAENVENNTYKHVIKPYEEK